MSVSFTIIMVWTYWPDNIVVVKSVITVDKKVYYPGDRITYTFSYCKTRKLPGTVVRSLDNSIRITFTSIESDLQVGCHTINVSDLVIPDYVDAGKYHIEGTGEYHINPIRSYFNFWKSEEFEIIKKDYE
jgi:hypothetical protein